MELLILVAVLVVYNVIVNRFLPQRFHVIFSVVLSIALIAWVVANSSEINTSDIGASADKLIPGFLWGIGALFIIWLFIGSSVYVPFIRNFTSDDRVINLNTRQLLYKTLVNIPIGTVFLEEVIFRGIMLALLMQNFSTITSVIISSLLFGLWHVLPALTNSTTNPKLKSIKKPGLPVVIGTVLVTFLAGVVFSWLRLVSGSLLAPMMAHYATNSGGAIASWWAHNFKK